MYKSDWYRGSFLNERVDLNCFNFEPRIVDEIVHKWRIETGLKEDKIFLQRLSKDQLTINQFRSIISKMEHPSKPSKTKWIDSLLKIIDHAKNISDEERNDLTKNHLSLSPLSRFHWPFLSWAKHSYKQVWKNRLNDHQLTPIVASLLSILSQQLINLSYRTLILEFNVARLQETIDGSSLEELLLAFANKYLTSIGSILELLREYPVLARLLTIRTTNWIHNSILAVERYNQNREKLEAHFNVELGEIQKIQGGISDLHKKGQSTLIFHFSNGVRLLYKPRSLKIAVQFQNLLKWINNHGQSPAFPILHILDCGEYGWEEFVQSKPCSNESEIQNFYKRQGGYLALLYLLEGTDFHRENVIASGEYPYLVDLEGLFHNQFKQTAEPTAMKYAYDEMKDSVLRTGLLPFLIGNRNKDQQRAEMSGLGGSDGQMTPIDVLQLEENGLELRLIRKPSKIVKVNNRPTINGQDVDPINYKEQLLQGFQDTYKLFMRNKKELLNQLSMFKGIEVRFISRPTYLYGLFIEDGCHPDHLRNGLDLDRLFDRLWVGLQYMPDIATIIPSEKNDLLHGDIPFFYSKTDSKDLWDSENNHFQNFFSQNVLQKVLQRCQSLNDEDCKKQMYYIQSSLGNGSIAHLHTKTSISRRLKEINTVAEPQEYLEAAIQIGRQLEKTAIWGENRKDATWLGIELTGSNQWHFAPASEDLYSGLTGIALFLAYLAEQSGQDQFAILSKAALNATFDILQKRPHISDSISAFQGRGSVIYTLLHLYSLWKDKKLLETAMIEAEKLIPSIPNDQSFDLLAGSAGTILVLLHLAQLTKSDLPVQIAILCGEHLLKHAQKMPQGHGWKHPSYSQPLGGLSHGTAGIALALAKLGLYTKQIRFTHMAHSAIAYERSLYDEKQKNWLDIRNQDFSCAWCHGAPGIGISRLLLMDLLSDQSFKQEIAIAIDTTKREGFGANHCLCHGDFGNLELFLLAGQKLNRPELITFAHKIATNALQTFKREQQWRSGWSTIDNNIPGLMVGISGIGLSLLRLYSQLHVPTPLYLSLPTNRTE